ncbi:hypothetical protein GXW78_19905 [Roseomonas terrae]|uniref:ABC-type transport auxiliary lipoprotein component domain-containing protein n=1 Tax=Neoroseomonas terrae TaxID=424799 RepID=A0ABS5ELP0_9PROT|nr:hypothetical protein [Neoroseomonas terrae]MBR0651940.1 hypothetical protein [Neoroseomonas terrae]
MAQDFALPRRSLAVALAGLTAACSTRPPLPPAQLPFDPAAGFADPGNQAIINTASYFASPGQMAGQPWVAAHIISQAEFLVIELNVNQRWIEMSPLAKMALEQARPEWRAAIGIEQAALPQPVINAMTAVRMDYGGQNPTAAPTRLQPPLFTPGGDASLAKLSNLPLLPRSAQAAQMVFYEFLRIQRQGQDDSWP